MRQKVLVTTSSFGQYSDAVLEKLKNHDLQLITNPYKHTLTEIELLQLLEKERPVGLLAGTEPITAKVLETAAGYIRVISRVGTGWDNINHKAAGAAGVKVYRTPDAATEAVAELTLGLILNLLRKLNQMDQELKSGLWEKRMGSLLQYKKLGIIGFGKIGKRLAQLMVPFDVQVGYYDVVAIHDGSSNKAMDLDSLLAWSDIVTLHVSASPKTDVILTKKRIKLMKRGSCLINVSRGGLVDETALYDALRDQHLSGAALDVFESEPYDGILRFLSNVILTPHIGSYARESRVRMEMEAVDNLIEGLR